MLDTVLQIGKTFRNAPNGLKYHRYIKSPVQQRDWEKIVFLSLPVRKDFSFDFDALEPLTDENLKSNLYYLTYKTTEADNQVKYLFGDIYYTLSDGIEGGYYKMAQPNNKQKTFQKSSFDRCEKTFMEFVKKVGENPALTIIKNFRENFKKNIDKVENLLKFQNAFVEYFENRNKYSYEVGELLVELNEMKVLNAYRNLVNIKLRKNYNKILTEKLQLENETSSETIRNDINKIEVLSSFSTYKVYLHFNFSGSCWYELENIFELINSQFLDEFIEETTHVGKKYILKKGLYKTLSTSGEDFQFPAFSVKNRYKNKIFNNIEEIKDLIYAINYSKTALIRIPNSNIKIIILPKGVNLSAEDYERFIGKDISLKDEPKQENLIKYSNEIEDGNTTDQLFANITRDGNESIIQFDLIISKQGGRTSPDSDLIELAGLEKSFINFISSRIQKIAIALFDERAGKIQSEKLKPFSINYSFLNILGDDTREKKKYQSHLYKVLPQIYSGTYYNDSILLHAFIEKAEQKIRNGEAYYNSFKYDFYFLTTIQNTLIQGENLMKILESPSYKLGLFLGKMAVPLKFEIKSFEKNYVGNLTRRIASLDDLIKFKSDIEQKLIMHDKMYLAIKEASLLLAEDVKSFKNRFDKNECAFGFFENYFKF